MFQTGGVWMKRLGSWIVMLTVLGSCCACNKDNKAEKNDKTVLAAYPGGLAVTALPQFAVLGCDDNGISGLADSKFTGGIAFFLNLLRDRCNPVGKMSPATFDGAQQKMTFFLITNLLDSGQLETPEVLAKAWQAIYEAGHEIGLHTHTHPHGHELSAETWIQEMKNCQSRLTAPVAGGGIGIPINEIIGFRTPYLEYNPATFVAIEKMGLAYDCSIEEGLMPDENGRNFCWPYRLSEGSPGDRYSSRDHQRGTVGSHPDIWEFPVYVYIAPPDHLCAQYGLEPGFRDRLAKRVDYFNPKDGKITGFDWNLWVAFSMTKQEVLATLKYSFDERLAGNRAPFHLGLHSDIYSDGYESLPNSTPFERQEALRELLDYIQAKPESRIVSFRDLLKWINAPIGLER